jgi:hypothetical protein
MTAQEARKLTDERIVKQDIYRILTTIETNANKGKSAISANTDELVHSGREQLLSLGYKVEYHEQEGPFDTSHWTISW